MTQLPVYGRDQEIAVLRDALAGVDSGRSEAVLLEGEAGIGKSRLLSLVDEDARRRGMQIAAGRAEELEQRRPFGLMARILGCTSSSPDPRRAAIAALLARQIEEGSGPVTVSSDPGLQFRVVDAMVDLIEELTTSGPLVMIVDDLQWADPSSLLVLAASLRRLGYQPVALVGSARPVPRSPDLARLLKVLVDGGAVHLSLGGLDGSAVDALVANSCGAAPGPTLSTAVARAGGNPLFVTELISALREDQALRIVGDRSEISALPLSPTLRLTILRRLSFLPERTLAALRAASLLGSSFALSDLAVTTEESALDLSHALADALSARVLDNVDDRLHFRHDLIREAIYDDLPMSVRMALHREAGQRLGSAGRSTVQVAEQFSRGSAPGDAEAIGWITRAAREAADTSPGVATLLLERALELMVQPSPTRDRVRLQYANALLVSGRISESAEVCRTLLTAGHDRGLEAPILLCLGHALLAAGRSDEALSELQRVESSPAGQAERAGAVAWAALASLWTGDLSAALELADRGERMALEVGDEISASVARSVRACRWQLEARLGEALTEIDAALEAADRSPGRSGHRFPLHLSRGHILLDLDRTHDSVVAIDVGRQTNAELGLRWALSSQQMVGGLALYLTGDWDDAAAEIEDGFALADETGESLSVFIGHSVMALISLHRNDLRAAGEWVDAAQRNLESRRGSPYRGAWAVWAEALVVEASGDRATALKRLGACWDECLEAGLLLDLPVIGPDLVRLARGAGEDGRARQVCQAVAQIAAANEVPSMTGAALRCRGLAEDDPELLLAAADSYAQGPRVLETALAREEAGQLLLRSRRMSSCRSAVEAAMAAYENLNATRDIVRGEATLRAAGVRRGRRGARGRPQSGWDSLTPTEQAVAALVADGSSNPQIGHQLYVSPRTVQTHLAHIFTKLDISSRVQLAAEVARRGAEELTTPREG